MKKIFYLNYELFSDVPFVKERAEKLLNKLKADGFKVHVPISRAIWQFDSLFHLSPSDSSSGFEEKFKEISKILKGYDALVFHMGVFSQKYLRFFLDRIPNLSSIAIVSALSENYESEERIGVFDYESPELFEFLNK